MRSSINLVSPIVVEHRPTEKALIIAVSVFIGVFVIAGSMLGYLLSIRNQVSRVAAQQTTVQEQINRSPQQKVNALVLKDRLNDIAKILSSRQDINTQIKSVIAILPNSLTLSSFKIDDNIITLELTSSDLSVFDGLLEGDVQKLQSQQNSRIAKMTVESFQIQPDNPRYTMSASFELNK